MPTDSREDGIEGLTRPLETPPLQIRCIREGEAIRVAGEIDLWSAPVFSTALADVAAEPLLVVDLRDVTFMDSSGIHALLKLREVRGGEPFTILPSPQVLTVLQLTGLDALPSILMRPVERRH